MASFRPLWIPAREQVLSCRACALLQTTWLQAPGNATKPAPLGLGEYAALKFSQRRRRWAMQHPPYRDYMLERAFMSASCSLAPQAANASPTPLDQLRKKHKAELAVPKGTSDESLEDVAQEPGPRLVKHSSIKWKIGAFQHLPSVPPSYEILGSALRKARMVRPTKGIRNAMHRERNKSAKQLDQLTKDLAMPLGMYVKRFPARAQLHPFERSLLELTLGEGAYEQTLHRVDLLRKKVLDTGKNYASLCAKAETKRDAEQQCSEGFTKLEELFKKQGKAVDNLKEVAKTLRFMPVVHPGVPTLCLVGAPNVGKSSLVRVLSSGKPEVCNYPFTTRGISMGHFFVDSRRHQVTDTPGLLQRPDEERNNMERLTLAALAHLPTAVLFVHDLTGECGTSVSNQLLIYKEMRERFPDKPWVDVVSKDDLLPPAPANEDVPPGELEAYSVVGPPGAFRVSIDNGVGLDQLDKQVKELLAQSRLGEDDEEGDVSGDDDQRSLQAGKQQAAVTEEFYFPAWPGESLKGI